MGMHDEPKRWERWVEEELVEKRPPRKPMTSEQKLEWLGEYCVSYKPTDNFFVIVDCLGQITSELNFNDALEIAIARFFAEA